MHADTPSVEDYLKTLLTLAADRTSVHSASVADALHVSRASVSRAMNILKESGYVYKESYGTILLTELGQKNAQSIKKRYDLIRTFLIQVLNVPEDVACKDACRIEHAVSEETVQQLSRYLEQQRE